MCAKDLKIEVSVAADPWQKAIRRQIMSIEMLNLYVAKLPEAQTNVKNCLLGDWAPVCGGEERLALVQT